MKKTATGSKTKKASKKAPPKPSAARGLRGRGAPSPSGAAPIYPDLPDDVGDVDAWNAMAFGWRPND
jgi:hypothetical protein